MAIIRLLRTGSRWWLASRRAHAARLAVLLLVGLVAIAHVVGWHGLLVALFVLAGLALGDVAWFIGRAGERTRWGLVATPIVAGEPIPYWELPPALRVLRGGR